MVKKGLIGIIVFLICVSVTFGLNDLMPLTGNVKTTSGNPVNGNLQVQIYSAPTGGNLIYDSLTDFNNEVINGNYDVMLGSGVELNLSYKETYYMEIIINSEDIDFNGLDRQKFISSTGSINTIDTDGEDLTILNGHVGIGTDSPVGKLSITGFGNEVNSGGWNHKQVIRIDNNGNSNMAFLVFNNSGLADGYDLRGLFQSSMVNDFGVLRYDSSNIKNPTFDFYISEYGNVGVGTTDPVSPLEVSSGAGSLSITSKTAFLSQNLSFRTDIPGRVEGDVWRIESSIQNGGGLASDIPIGDLVFYSRGATTDTSLTERIRVTHDGDVGIGTTDPVYKLDIKPSANGPAIGVLSGNGWRDVMRLDESGRVGIGTTDPATSLQVVKAEDTVYSGVTPSILDSVFAVANNQASEDANDMAMMQFTVNGGTHNRVGAIGLVSNL